MRTALALTVGTALALLAPSALAQDTTTQPPPANPPAGTASASVGGGVDASATPKRTVVQADASAAGGGGVTATAKVEDTTPDHEKFSGHFAVGYLGLTNVPLGEGAAAGVTQGSVAAPIIGVRYWLNKQFGLDLGLGLGLESSSVETQAGNNTTTADGPAPFAVALHGGVPIALAAGKHYTFEVIPELNVAFARRADKAQNTNNPPPDLVHTGFRLDVGARVGAEVHFGFIGVPELALQASVGLLVSRQSWKNSQDSANGGNTNSTATRTTLGTTVQSDPWGLFVNNISALYYF